MTDFTILLNNNSIYKNQQNLKLLSLGLFVLLATILIGSLKSNRSVNSININTLIPSNNIYQNINNTNNNNSVAFYSTSNFEKHTKINSIITQVEKTFVIRKLA